MHDRMQSRTGWSRLRTASFLAFFAASTAGAVEISPAVTEAYAAMAGHASVKTALAFIKTDEARTLAEQKQIVAIPAPPFKEARRAEDFRQRLAAAGLANARIDKEGNVIAVRPGRGGGPKLVVSAHLDTVFPENTDLTVTEKNGRLYAPGIADDTRGLVELLSLVRALDAAKIETVGDLWFVGTVGEEGLGDLRGVRALFAEHRNFDGFISIDGSTPERITYIAVGSNRYRVSFSGPGGHSFGAFGRPSAIHAMGRAIAKIAELRPPAKPKTTFTVGTVAGGTSINSIAGDAVFELDMRSVGMDALLAFEAQALQAIRTAVDEENARWKHERQVSVNIEPVGSRPAGSQAADAPIIQAAMLAIGSIGRKPMLEAPASTDANLPISLGIPAMTVGRGGSTGDNHALSEWYDPTDAYLGVQKNLLTVLGLVGVAGVSPPILERR